ncbi:hypothetical protein TIFTF001_021971 [Ficus carica]|uniref:Uncharacterized protein n=1 Tax=Ficus carica TaxID=3494 RepID=A0AA88DB84_FICCA|nr:hypothetical protein TIFTF001_021971 [Ficus carica]
MEMILLSSESSSRSASAQESRWRRKQSSRSRCPSNLAMAAKEFVARRRDEYCDEVKGIAIRVLRSPTTWRMAIRWWFDSSSSRSGIGYFSPATCGGSPDECWDLDGLLFGFP